MKIKAMEIKEQPNPVGDVYIIDTIESQIDALKTRWDELTSHIEKSQWWEVWKWGQRTSLTAVSDFLIKALDDLIHEVDSVLDNGADKKATVLDAIGRLYDYVIREAMPIWLRPFGSQVKTYIIEQLVSTAIDWIVDKYRNGAWRENWDNIAHGGEDEQSEEEPKDDTVEEGESEA